MPIVATYEGQPLTPENIRQFLPVMPPDLADIVDPYLQEHRELFQQLVVRKLPLSQFTDEMKEKRELYKHAELTNCSNNNYIFAVSKDTSTKAYIKISSLLSRLNKLLFFNGKTQGIWSQAQKDSYKNEELDRLEIVSTYQTLSRAAYYLRIKDEIAKRQLRFIAIPTTYARSITDADLLDDENAIIIDEAVNGAVRLEEVARELTFHQIYELVELIKAGGVWAFGGNVLFKDDTFFYLDLEQPDNSNPQDYFFNNKKKEEWNKYEGINTLALLLKPYSEQFNFLKQLIRNDADINASAYYKTDISKLFQE